MIFIFAVVEYIGSRVKAEGIYRLDRFGFDIDCAWSMEAVS